MPLLEGILNQNGKKEGSAILYSEKLLRAFRLFYYFPSLPSSLLNTMCKRWQHVRQFSPRKCCDSAGSKFCCLLWFCWLVVENDFSPSNSCRPLSSFSSSIGNRNWQHSAECFGLFSLAIIDGHGWWAPSLFHRSSHHRWSLTEMFDWLFLFPPPIPIRKSSVAQNWQMTLKQLGKPQSVRFPFSVVVSFFLSPRSFIHSFILRPSVPSNCFLTPPIDQKIRESKATQILYFLCQPIFFSCQNVKLINLCEFLK